MKYRKRLRFAAAPIPFDERWRIVVRFGQAATAIEVVGTSVREMHDAIEVFNTTARKAFQRPFVTKDELSIDAWGYNAPSPLVSLDSFNAAMKSADESLGIKDE